MQRRRIWTKKREKKKDWSTECQIKIKVRGSVRKSTRVKEELEKETCTLEKGKTARESIKEAVHEMNRGESYKQEMTTDCRKDTQKLLNSREVQHNCVYEKNTCLGSAEGRHREGGTGD